MRVETSLVDVVAELVDLLEFRFDVCFAVRKERLHCGVVAGSGFLDVRGGLWMKCFREEGGRRRG